MLDKGSLTLGTLEQSLQNVDLWRIVVSVQLLVVAMLVPEHAASAVHALLRVIERPAVLALELVVVDAASSLCKFLLPVGKSAFALIPTLGSLNPIFAKFSFILAIGIGLDHLGSLLEALSWVECLRLASISLVDDLVCVEGGLLAVVERLGRYLEALDIRRLEA